MKTNVVVTAGYQGTGVRRTDLGPHLTMCTTIARYIRVKQEVRVG